MTTDVTFQRRRHPRFHVDLEGALLLNTEPEAVRELPCKVIGLSRHGLKLNVPGPLELYGNQNHIRLVLSDTREAIAAIRFLRATQHSETRSEIAAELLFRNEEARRKIHTFLSGLPGVNLDERRSANRRSGGEAKAPEKRIQIDRRREYGIFNDSILFSNRASNRAASSTLFRPTEATLPGRITINGKQLISFGSTDYLGLSHDDRVKRAATVAINKYGTATGSRVLNGTLNLHDQFESELADFKNQEAALVFSGGYLANVALLTAVLKEQDLVFLDEKAHVSIIDGVRFSGAELIPFRHNSVEDLESKLRRKQKARSLIIVDGVYSIEGDLAALSDIHSVSESRAVPLMVDDAHGFGVMGTNGSGTAEHFGLNGKIDLDMGTMSGSLGSVGGFVACRKHVADFLREFSRGFRYTTSLPPAVIAGLLEALKIIKNDSTLRERLWSNAASLKDGLARQGYLLSRSESTILSVRLFSERVVYDTIRLLEARGIYVSPFTRPAVKRGDARIRLTVSAAHSKEDIGQALSVFEEIKPKVDSMIQTAWTQ